MPGKDFHAAAAARRVRRDGRADVEDHVQVNKESGGRRRLAPGDPWTVAAIACLFGGAVLLLVAWYDISGTANLYEQMPYLVSAGFTGLGLILVGSALMVAGREHRVERRLVQLVDALTEAGGGPNDEVTSEATTEANGKARAQAAKPPDDAPEPLETAAEAFLVVPGSLVYHRAGCLLLGDKDITPASEADIASGALTPCPVCDP